MLVLGDTHLRAGSIDRMPTEVWAMAEAADLVLHAGDVVDRAVIDALAEHAPVLAVLGNNDGELADELPETVETPIAGVSVAMVHNSGPTRGRPSRLARRFPNADVIVFGHSHTPTVGRIEGGPLLLNPGSPTQRRRQPVHTVAWLQLDDGHVSGAEIRPVGPLAD